MNRIGYAVINKTLKPSGYQTCRIKSPYEKGIDYVIERVMNNLEHFLKVLHWNVDHDMKVYRVSNELFPLSTHPDFLRDFTWRWYEDTQVMGKLSEIKAYVEDHGIRVTMHPDPYTVLNSMKDEVLNRSIVEVENMTKVLEAIGGSDLVVYMGGHYGNPRAAKNRFMDVYKGLSKEAQSCIRLKNDDSHFTLTDCLDIYDEVGLSIVFDYHHFKCNHKKWEDLNDLIGKVYHTWEEQDMLVHLSSGKEGPYDINHGDEVDPMDVLYLKSIMSGRHYDLLVEAKNREQAVMAIR